MAKSLVDDKAGRDAKKKRSGVNANVISDSDCGTFSLTLGGRKCVRRAQQDRYTTSKCWTSALEHPLDRERHEYNCNGMSYSSGPHCTPLVKHFDYGTSSNVFSDQRHVLHFYVLFRLQASFT